ncbi:MAG: hypothetical protein ACXAE3_05490 [Candidatus Kariarchaeaceae archaeon]|jgi:hypothetical protein
MFAIDFRILWWWIMILLQLIAELMIRDASIAVRQELSILAFEFHFLYGMILLLNFIVRYFLVIEDERIFKSFRLRLHVRFNLVTDVLLLILSVLYSIVSVRLL